MNIHKNQLLAPYTSLRVGGRSERLILTDTYDETLATLQTPDTPLWFLGFGSNCLISDQGLPGNTVMWRGGEISIDDDLVVADAGVWWDDVVQRSIEAELWGLELMSEIPSGVGGAIFGNIAAYGQQVSDTLEWIEVFDTNAQATSRIPRGDIEMSYRASSLQQQPNIIILRAAFRLSKSPLHELKYDSALKIAEQLNLETDSLEHRRAIIIETRKRAGSIYHPNDPNPDRTAGSFFKNPIVTNDQAIELAKFDETGKTLQRIMNQNKIHGGNTHRASAAHILLAAGFKRSQTWDKVRLHPDHVLKIQTLEGATAQEVFEVAHEIIGTVEQKLSLKLEPEVKFIGDFT